MKARLQVSNVLDKDTVQQVRNLVDAVIDPYWVTRTDLSHYRGIDGSSCRYKFLGHAQMPADLKNFLKKLAPNYPNFFLAEIAVNRYDEGDYIGKHKDRHLYRRNLVVALQEFGDGLYVDETKEFIEDVAGQGVLFEGVGPIHSVPPVKNKRYCLIYLYE